MILVLQRDQTGNPAAWLDLDTRLAHDRTSGAETTRPFTDAENTRADAISDAAARTQTRQTFRDQLATGVAAVVNAREAAREDIATAQGLRATTLAARADTQTQRAAVAAFVPASTYSAAQLAAVRDQLVQVLDRQAATLQALAGNYAYRVAVDTNAIDTDNALLWLARLASGLLDDPEA